MLVLSEVVAEMMLDTGSKAGITKFMLNPELNPKTPNPKPEP